MVNLSLHMILKWKNMVFSLCFLYPFPYYIIIDKPKNLCYNTIRIIAAILFLIL